MEAREITSAAVEVATATIGGAELLLDRIGNGSHVLSLLSSPSAFFSACKILGEDDLIQYAEPTPTQVEILNEIDQNRWTLINKYRQAKATTCIAIGVLLRDCMYGRGISGVIIAQDHTTSEMVFEKILYAYDTLPDSVKTPLNVGRKKGAHHIIFHHGGGIKVLTMGGRSPGVGRGVSRILITELGEAVQQRRALINLFPAFNKRPNAKVIVESTPGRSGTPHEHLWRMSLEGRGRFRPLFLKWWKDETCTADATGAPKLTQEEIVFLAKNSELSIENALFRRAALDTEFVGDPRLFSAKYPSDELDGWLGSLNPTLPADVIKSALEESVRDGGIDDAGWGCSEIERPNPFKPYLITADPAGYGASGDPSALTVWDASEGCEVAFWSGREDPGKFATRLMRIQERYRGNDPRGALLAVESNAGACVATLRDRDCSRLFWSKRQHPGWYANAQRLKEAEGRLVKMLRDGDIIVRSRGTLHQLLDYDGSRRDERKTDSEDEVHHFDRARTVVMAADILSTRRFSEAEPLQEMPKPPPRTLPVALLDMLKEREKADRGSPFRPPTR